MIPCIQGHIPEQVRCADQLTGSLDGLLGCSQGSLDFFHRLGSFHGLSGLGQGGIHLLHLLGGIIGHINAHQLDDGAVLGGGEGGLLGLLQRLFHLLLGLFRGLLGSLGILGGLLAWARYSTISALMATISA